MLEQYNHILRFNRKFDLDYNISIVHLLNKLKKGVLQFRFLSAKLPRPKRYFESGDACKPKNPFDIFDNKRKEPSKYHSTTRTRYAIDTQDRCSYPITSSCTTRTCSDSASVSYSGSVNDCTKAASATGKSPGLKP